VTTMKIGQSLAELLGSECHRANRDGAWAFPGGDLLLFIPDSATLAHLEAARDFIDRLAAERYLRETADCGGT
jgi:hypothetical protein